MSVRSEPVIRYIVAVLRDRGAPLCSELLGDILLHCTPIYRGDEDVLTVIGLRVPQDVLIAQANAMSVR